MSLLERIGGVEAASAVVHSLLVKIFADPVIGIYFNGVNLESHHKNLSDFLVPILAGNAPENVGEKIIEAHHTLHISDEAYTAFVKHIKQTLDEFNVPAKEHGELVAIFESVRKAVCS